MPAALYAIDTQKMGLCLLRKDLEGARRVLASSVTSPDVYPDLIHVRNRNLQRYFEQTQNYHKAYDYLKKTVNWTTPSATNTSRCVRPTLPCAISRLYTDVAESAHSG